jgi:hypothetical protein
MQARSVASSSTLGRIAGQRDDRVGCQHQRVRMLRDRLGLLPRQPQRVVARQLARGTLSSISAGATASGNTPMRASSSSRAG